jgi:hypothetical protein
MSSWLLNVTSNVSEFQTKRLRGGDMFLLFAAIERYHNAQSTDTMFQYCQSTQKTSIFQLVTTPDSKCEYISN